MVARAFGRKRLEGVIVVKHLDPLQEANDGGRVLQIRWHTLEHVVEVVRVATRTVGSDARATGDSSNSPLLVGQA